MNHKLSVQNKLALQEKLITWRRALHQIPECRLDLPNTYAYIKEQLDEMNVAYTGYDDVCCIVAMIGEGERCFMLRSDIDALPLTEESSVSFKSTNGCMHACGHDLHAAILLGAAKILKENESSLNGRVMLFFQAGEESTQGAIAMLEKGLLVNPRVDAAFAVHVNPLIPYGVLKTGKEAMAGTLGFSITIHGKGGHGSSPEICIDPINAAVQVYLAFQSIIAREVSASNEAVLTIGQFNAGDAANIIPARAVLKGTLRTFKPAVKEYIVQRMKEVTQGVAQTYRCTADFEVKIDCNSLITDDETTACMKESMLKVNPELILEDDGHWMGSEDFAEFSQRIPSSHFMLGAAPLDENKRYSLHDPRVEFNEDAILLGAEIYAQCAVDWLKNH